jgi:hypothetical protein
MTLMSALFAEVLVPTSGKAVGWYGNGDVAAVVNDYGHGHTLLLGTFLGISIEQVCLIICLFS